MKVCAAIRTARTLGLKTSWHRLIQAARLKSGYIEWLDASGPFTAADLTKHLAPGHSIAAALHQFQQGPAHFFYEAHDLGRRRGEFELALSPEARTELLDRVERLSRGEVRLFSGEFHHLGCPINWNLNPQSGLRMAVDHHWRRCEQLDARQGDIKFLWEASRFPFLYDLVRAYALKIGRAHV